MSPPPIRAYIGLGANLGNPRAQIAQAFKALASLPESLLFARSGLYQSAARETPDPQPDYLNAVAALDTRLSAADLLARLLAIEGDLGRQRPHWHAARTLDLDLLLYGDSQIDTPSLQVPHPRMHQRAFVLAPLVEVAPATVLPNGQSALRLLDFLADQAVQRLPE